MTTPPGWHPDPSGRHQHRFWDGSGWTDQVSDDGVTATDPIDAPVAAAAGGGQAGGDPWGGDSTAPTSGKSKAPMFVGIAVVVALIAGGIFFLVNRDGSGSSSSSGTGDHNLTVKADELTVHTFDARAGDFIYIGYDQTDSVNAALGIPQAALDDLREFEDLPEVDDLHRYSNDLAERLFSPMLEEDGAESTDGLRSIAGFDGYLVEQLGQDGIGLEAPPGSAASITVSPVDATYSVLMSATGEDTEVELNIRVETPPDVPDPVTSEALADLYSSDAMEDFRRRMAEEFGLTLGGGFTDEFTDDWSDDFTDDWTDWSDDFTDDWTDWSDDFTDEWNDWSQDWSDLDDWSDWSDEWSDTWSEFDDVMSDWSDEFTWSIED